MARINIPEPQKILFQTQLTIQISDINYGNHLANDAILRFCHETRLRWLNQYHFTEINAGGTGLIMVDAGIQYISQGYYGEHIEINLGVTDISRSTFTLLYHLYNIEKKKTIARAQTGMACFDYQRQKISSLPNALQTILNNTSQILQS